MEIKVDNSAARDRSAPASRISGSAAASGGGRRLSATEASARRSRSTGLLRPQSRRRRAAALSRAPFPLARDERSRSRIPGGAIPKTKRWESKATGNTITSPQSYMTELAMDRVIKAAPKVPIPRAARFKRGRSKLPVYQRPPGPGSYHIEDFDAVVGRKGPRASIPKQTYLPKIEHSPGPAIYNPHMAYDKSSKYVATHTK